MFKSKIYPTRYQAEKAKHASAWFNGAEICVKVCGGYVLMDAEDYRIWKMQK